MKITFTLPSNEVITQVWPTGTKVLTQEDAPPEIVKMVSVRDDAKRLADARTDYAALRQIRDGFGQSSDRLTLANLFTSKGLDAGEFCGLLVANGQTPAVAEQIAKGINESLGLRGQA